MKKYSLYKEFTMWKRFFKSNRVNMLAKVGLFMSLDNEFISKYITKIWYYCMGSYKS